MAKIVRPYGLTFCRRIYGDNFKLVKKELVQPFLLAPKSGDLFISSDLFDPRLRPRGIGDAFAVHLQTVSAMNMVLGDRMLMKATKCVPEICDVFREWGYGHCQLGSFWHTWLATPCSIVPGLSLF